MRVFDASDHMIPHGQRIGIACGNAPTHKAVVLD